MKRLFLLLILVFVIVYTGLAQTPATGVHTPGPTYPPDALKAKITGSGTCQVVFDAAGHVDKATMTKTTGSKILDENTLSFARTNWTGKPNTSTSVPIAYQLAKPPKGAAHVFVPFPPYPYQARANHLHGNGIVKVTFDKNGKVISATMSKFTGEGILDSNTINYALAKWKSSGGEKKTIFVPVSYRLQ